MCLFVLDCTGHCVFESCASRNSVQCGLIASSKGSLARPTTYWSPLGLVQRNPDYGSHLPYWSSHRQVVLTPLQQLPIWCRKDSHPLHRWPQWSYYNHCGFPGTWISRGLSPCEQAVSPRSAFRIMVLQQWISPVQGESLVKKFM